MDSKPDDFIITFDKLKKRFGHTPEFKLLERKYSYVIDFSRFKKENLLRHNQKTGWNKPFIVTFKNEWFTDKKHWNKEFKKYGYFVCVLTGWKLVQDKDESKCKWCGKLLPDDPRVKYCTENFGRHRKLYNKVLKKGKELYGFDITKNNHFLIKPKLWEYCLTKKGRYEPIRTDIERIKFKNIEFSINGERHSLTKKSRII